MAELYRARCAQGHIIVTDDAVLIELGAAPGSGGMPMRQQRLPRSMMTSVDAKVTMMSLFGMGGAVTLTIHGQGAEVLRATLVPPKAAREIVRLLS